MIIKTVSNTRGPARARRLGAAACAGALAFALAACSAGAPAASTSGSAAAGADPIPVLTSTNVWGDVVRQVGGEHVAVTAVISEPSADPHAYQATARDQLALSKAALIVENGGGYDDFMSTMIASSGSTAPVIDAVEVSGLDHADDGAQAGGSGDDHGTDEHGHGEFNEHVWYDLPTVAKVADAVAQQLATIDPADADAFRANVAAFKQSLTDLTGQVDQIKAAHAGTEVAITEPVPLYLIEAAGLQNATPEEFSEAIESETDVPAAVMDRTLRLFTDKTVAVLVTNEQTTGPQTQAVVEAATAAGIPVVPVTETLPDGQDYLSWMKTNIQALAQALGG